MFIAYIWFVNRELLELPNEKDSSSDSDRGWTSTIELSSGMKFLTLTKSLGNYRNDYESSSSLKSLDSVK